MPTKLTPTPAEQAADELARQLLAAGHSPAEIMAGIMGAAEQRNVFQLPVRRQPEPRDAPDEVSTFRIRVDLDHAKPPIWRRLELRSDLRLDQVHDVLQTAMGWTDSHLHGFEMGPVRDRLVERFVTAYDLEEGDEGILQSDVRLDQVLAEVGDRLFYEYDFGDSWDHTLRLEAVSERDEHQPTARVLDGRRACPPEDCGGIPGYEQLLDGLADPSGADEWLRERLEWMPEDFDPAEFDAAATEVALQDMLRISRAAVLPERLAEPFADLVRRTPWGPGFALPELIAQADLGDPGTPDPETRAELVRPWLHLVELAAEDGIQLTQAGYLKPDVVVALGTELGLAPWWGKGNREEHSPLVASLRTSAMTMGLVRKHKGRLVTSPAGAGSLATPRRCGVSWWRLSRSASSRRSSTRARSHWWPWLPVWTLDT